MNETNLLQIEGMENTMISPAKGVAAIALNFALKYHDINTVQDGTLYQQYKLEGRNMTSLHLDHVFETAIAIEKHLLLSENRVSKLLIDTFIEAANTVLDEEDSEQSDDESRTIPARSDPINEKTHG